MLSKASLWKEQQELLSLQELSILHECIFVTAIFCDKDYGITEEDSALQHRMKIKCIKCSPRHISHDIKKYCSFNFHITISQI